MCDSDCIAENINLMWFVENVRNFKPFRYFQLTQRQWPRSPSDGRRLSNTNERTWTVDKLSRLFTEGENS